MRQHLSEVLLDAGGGQLRPDFRLYGDEDLHHAALAVWREQVNAADALPALEAAYGPTGAARRLIAWCLYLGAVRARLAEEEGRRERARARGMPRDGGRGWVPEEVVRAVKAGVDLPELVQRWGLADLRARGRGVWLGRCPFHEDRTPSFYVYAGDPADQHWHCFGCGAHGDAFTLAMRHGAWLSFRDAAEGLAGLAGVPWPPPEPGQPDAGRFLALARGDRADG